MPVFGVTYCSSGGIKHKGHVSSFPSLQILGKVIRATLLRESLFIWFSKQPSSTHFRRLDDGRRGVQVEAAGPGAVRQEPLPARRIRAHEVGKVNIKLMSNLLASFTCFLCPFIIRDA